MVWNVLKIECAFLNVPFSNVLFSECVLSAQNQLSPFWNVIKMKCALFGMCFIWNVLFLKCALFGM